MSRWMDQYNSHAYKHSWDKLKEVLNDSKPSISQATPDAEEFFRLNKAVKFIQEILEGLDPELLPLNIWANFHTQCEAAKNELINFNNNRVSGHLVQANNHVDNLLTYVRPYMVARGKAAIALRNSAVSSAAEINDFYAKFKLETEQVLEHVDASKKEASNYFEEIQKLKDRLGLLEGDIFGEDGTENRLNEFVGTAESSMKKITNFSEELFYGTEGEESIRHSIKKASEESIKDQLDLNELLKKSQSQVDSLGDFYLKIYGVEVSQDGEREGGLNSYLDEKVKTLDEFEGAQKNKYEALVHEIESLLPGATSAGLAKAYSDLKDTFDKPIKHSSYLFYGAIGALVFFSVIMSIESASLNEGVKFVSFSQWDSVLQGLVYKLPVYVPVIWLAFFASKRRSESQRLQQEYAHKEALAKSYHSYKKQIEELSLEDGEMMKGLIAKAIDTISFNASVTLDKKHGDKTPTHHVAETVVDGIISKARSKTSV